MVQFVEIIKDNCTANETENETKNCYSVRVLETMGARDTVVMYEFFQSGIIFISLIAGLVCLGHVVYGGIRRCRNWELLVTTLVTGFFHLLWDILLLRLSEESAHTEIPRGGTQQCIDYSKSASLSSSILFIAISISIITNNSNSLLKKYVLAVSSVTSVLIGLIFLVRKWNADPVILEQKVFVSLGEQTANSHIDMFWSVCLKHISEEKMDFLYEYCLIYLPVFLIFIWAWSKSISENKHCSPLKVAVVRRECENKDEINPFCICTKLNPAYIAVLFYAALLLFVIRPVYVIYGYSTTDTFRDVLPSLLHTVIYCFICSEYLLWMYKRNLYKFRNRHLIIKGTMRV